MGERKEKRMFTRSSREIMNQLIKERKHGPKCGCDGCFTFLYAGNRQLRKYLPGSYLVNYWQDKEQRSILPN